MFMNALMVFCCLNVAFRNLGRNCCNLKPFTEMPKYIYMTWTVNFLLVVLLESGVFVADAVKSESVTEGESVSLNSRFTQIQTHEEIEWKFGDILIATVNNKERVFYDESAEGRFRDRLKLDQTGSLTIINSRTTDSGLYTVSSSRDTINTINLTVYARLPVPVISSNSSQNSSSSSCSLVCSAMNVSHVTLSWFKGNSVFSSIRVSDLSSRSDLLLHLECVDDSYSCVLNNPIRNQTQHLNNTQLCHTCAAEDRIHCCGFTEAVIRLALSALVGVATVVVLVYDIRSRSLQQKKSVQKYPSNSD